MTKGEVFRFAVGDPEGKRSAVWRLWTQGNDIYLMQLSASFVKISIHESGASHLKLEKKYLESKDSIFPEDKNPYELKWYQPMLEDGEVWQAFTVVIPELALFPWPEKSFPLETKKPVHWYEPTPQEGEEVRFYLVLGAPDTELPDEEKPYLVHSMAMSDAILWVLAETKPVHPMNEDLAKSALSDLFEKMGGEFPDELGRRAVSFGTNPDYGTHAIEFALDFSAPPEPHESKYFQMKKILSEED